jgi:hypothetical protein
VAAGTKGVQIVRQYEVDWQTFEQALPPKGAPIVVEIERASKNRAGETYTHRSECRHVVFDGTMTAHRNGKHAGLFATFQYHNSLPMSSRWYLAGSERLKPKGPAST